MSASTDDFIAALTRLARSGEDQRCGTFKFILERGGRGFRTLRADYLDEGISYLPTNKNILRLMAQSFARRDAPLPRGPMMKGRDDSEL